VSNRCGRAALPAQLGYVCREDQRPDSRQEWRSGRSGGSRDGERPFRDDVENRLFSGNRPNPESRRGAFGFHTQDADRSRASMPARAGSRSRGSDNGSGLFGHAGALGRASTASASRLEEYGLRPGSLPGGEKPLSAPKPPDDYVGPASQMLGSSVVFSSTLLAAGVAPPSINSASAAANAEEADSEEDAELVAHYKELELIKAEEEEKDRQRALAAEAPVPDTGSIRSAEEDGGGAEEGTGGTWEDAADEGIDGVMATEESMGMKPVDPQKWMQRQVCPFCR
jgi:hypothetical protein